MTIESGSSRHTGDQITDKVLAAQGLSQPIYGELQAFESRRMPDAVRAAALANAVDLMAGAKNHTLGDVMKVAKEFEAYLTGEIENSP